MIVDLDLHSLRLAVAEDEHGHGRAYVGHADHVYQLAVVIDGDVVEFQDYVALQEFGGLAGVRGVTAFILAPIRRGSPASVAASGPKREFICTPIYPRVTLPVSMSCPAENMNMLMESANPQPSLTPELLAMAVLMPMTSPWTLLPAARRCCLG